MASCWFNLDIGLDMNTTNQPNDMDEPLSAVVLAGGRARRMGGTDKGLIPFMGKPLVAQICTALQPQVAELMINANRNLPEYQQLGYSVIQDELDEYQGPLAGMHAALCIATHAWLLTVPCDAPFVADDYAEKMLTTAHAEKVQLAVAHDGNRLQPVYSLIHRDLVTSLNQFLESGERKIDRWFQQHTFATVDFSEQARMFTNINTMEQLAEAEAEAGAEQQVQQPAQLD